MKRLRSGMSKLFFPKQDEYTELKAQLRKLSEDVQNCIRRSQLDSSRFLDFRSKYFNILEAKRKLPPQAQNKLQEKIDDFLKKFKVYRFDKQEKSNFHTVLSRDNLGTSEMQTTIHYNLRHTSPSHRDQTTSQTSFHGNWAKTPEQVLSSSETNKTSVSQNNDFEMKDLSEQNREDIADQLGEIHKEDKNWNLPSGKSSLLQKEKDQEDDKYSNQPTKFAFEKQFRRRSNEGKTGNFQQDEDSPKTKTSYYQIYKRDCQTQTTPSFIKQSTNTTHSVLENKFQNLSTKSEDFNNRKLEINLKHDRCGKSGRPSLQQKEEPQKTPMSFDQEDGHNERKTRSFQQTHFDTPKQHFGNRNNYEPASSRIARSIAQNNESERNRRCSRDQYQQGLEEAYSRHGTCYEKEIEDVRIQMEDENKYSHYQKKEVLRQDEERVKTFISEDKLNQKSIYDNESERNSQNRRCSRDPYHQGPEEALSRHEKEIENVKVQMEDENKYSHYQKKEVLRQNEERVKTFISEDKLNQKSLYDDESERNSQNRRCSRDPYHQGPEEAFSRHEKEIENVRVQMEDQNKYSHYHKKEVLRQDEERVKTFINEDKLNQKSLHDFDSNAVLILEKDGAKTVISQQSIGSSKEKGQKVVERNQEQHQHQYRSSIEQRKCYQGRFSNENRSREISENKNITSKSDLLQSQEYQTPQELRGRGRLLLNRSANEPTTRTYQDQKFSPVDANRSYQQQNRKGPGIARPVHTSDRYHDIPQTNMQEDHRKAEVEVATKVVEEPLQIVDVHKYFQDDFDLKSLDASTDAITQIETVKKWAETFEEKVSNFSEEKFSLQYFVLDEKLMRLIEHLDKLKCREDKVATLKKIEVIEYIKGLHKTLDLRAIDE